jgi:hypothetical protein
VERQPVESSVIGAVGYSHVLEIQFESGRIYQYYGVPEDVYHGMLNADSKGKYFNSHIRGKYAYREIEVKSAQSSSGKQDTAAAGA